jgi:glycosyltransferase involved in cell wall biosynthesis
MEKRLCMRKQFSSQKTIKSAVTPKRVAVYSTGIPDPSQGGSGIFNYYVIKALLENGYEVDGYFRAGEWFLQAHTVGTFLGEMEAQGLNCMIIDEEQPRRRRLFGLELLLASHQVAVCSRVVDEVVKSQKSYVAHIAHDLGWIVALAGRVAPVVGLVGDPLPNRLRHGHELRWNSPRSWLLRLQALSAGSRWVVRGLANRLNGTVVLGSFSPSHAKEYQDKGLVCEHFRWFSPEVTPHSKRRARDSDGVFRMLHVGTLESTASKNMLRYWMHRLLPELANLSFTVEIRFIGRGQQLDSGWKNIRLITLGYQESLDLEFQNCDVFFSPMRYPVGIRTRILTAMSYGVPTIADPSASQGLPELVPGHDIFYGRDPVEIKSIVRALYENPELLDAVGKSARGKWEQLFQPSQNVAVILQAAGLHHQIVRSSCPEGSAERH